MAQVEKSIDVDVPVRTAYNQWTQFEEFPRFMEGVEAVHQLDDQRFHWRASIGGKTEEWDAVITEQSPDMRVAWRSTSGAGASSATTAARRRASERGRPAPPLPLRTTACSGGDTRQRGSTPPAPPHDRLGRSRTKWASTPEAESGAAAGRKQPK